MVEDRIKQWILKNYGEVSASVKHEMLMTFEMYWDQFNFRYAEIYTLKTYPPPLFSK